LLAVLLAGCINDDELDLPRDITPFVPTVRGDATDVPGPDDATPTWTPVVQSSVASVRSTAVVSPTGEPTRLRTSTAGTPTIRAATPRPATTPTVATPTADQPPVGSATKAGGGTPVVTPGGVPSGTPAAGGTATVTTTTRLPTATPAPTQTPAPTATATLAPATPTRVACDPSYPTVCIPPAPPDLDCAEVPFRRFQVLPPDPHGFDGDKDGIGCETT
jgi:hypothetical protein